MKSQSAIEFLSIISLGLILITVGSFFGYDYILSYTRQVDSMNAQSTVDNIVSAANLVYSQGVGSQAKVYVNMPREVSSGKTYLSRKTININTAGLDSDNVGYLPAEVQVSLLPIREGPKVLFVEMLPSGNIGIKINESVAYIESRLYNTTDYIYETDELPGIIYYTVDFFDFDNSLKSTNYTIDVYWPNGSSSIHQEGEAITGSISGNINPPAGPAGEKWVFSVSLPNQKLISNKAVFLD